MSVTKGLTEAQKAALAYVTDYARGRKSGAQKKYREVLKMANIPEDDYVEAVSVIKRNARVALHFHPDRPDSDGLTVAQSLLSEGLYRSQFETQISNGSITAFPGGDRDQWERELFGAAYHQAGVTPSERPKYGALDLMLHADGPSPRFGSCYFLLKPTVSKRCSFTYLDSHYNPEEKGTYDEFDDIMAALLFEAFVRDSAIGEPDLTPRRLIDHLCHHLIHPFHDPTTRLARRNLNHYIEAQIHGDVTLAEDVEILVTDPSFIDTPTGDVLNQLCEKYKIKHYFHCGFALDVDAVPEDFRGPTMPSLAQRIATDAYLTASMIGPAVMELKQQPAAWADRGTVDEVLHEFKLLWHVLVRCGDPLKTFPACH